MDYGLRKNAEGYSDPTAYQALKNVIQEESDPEKRMSTLVFILKYIVNAAGFDLMARIELRDRKTGRVFR